LIHNALVGVYESLADQAQALAAASRACAVGPELPACWFNYGRLLFVHGDLSAASAALQKAVALAPRHAYARTMLANILRADGRPSQAQAEFRTAVTQQAHAGQAWWGLTTLKPMPIDAADIKRMRHALQANEGAESDMISLGFALANALDHAGAYPEAFAVLTQAHARARRREPWDARGFAAHMERVLQLFAQVRTPAAEQGSEVIFVASLPRSGSTLTEQILASHSQVEGTTELPHLNALIAEESDRWRQPFPLWANKMSPERWLALGREYLARTARWREHKPRFTDKLPTNWMYVGAIRAMLPQARIVVVRRDSLENCLACWRFLFNQHAYTHDFGDLAKYWRAFDHAVRHWQALYPDHVRVQVYEQLVADPETQIRELLASCGLPFEEACLNFHATERRVTTPSAAQVREPLRSDTARADKYGALLDPLREALGISTFRQAEVAL
jgi:tetratricopeptide (TPR) repeat protein